MFTRHTLHRSYNIDVRDRYIKKLIVYRDILYFGTY